MTRYARCWFLAALAGGLVMTSGSALAQTPAPEPASVPDDGESASGDEPAPDDATAPSDDDEPEWSLEPEDTPRLPTLRIDALLPPVLEDVPGAATRVTQQQLETWRPYTLHEALRRIPGVHAIDDDGFARRAGIGIRGGAARRSRKVLLLEDGVSINASTYLDPSGHYTPPVERLESVEVLRGAGQIVHGPLNNHGIVNFRNLQPTLDPETVVSTSLMTNRGNRRHLRHRRTFQDTGVGDVGVVLAYTGADADGVFDVERLGFNDFYGATTLSAGKHTLTLSGVYYRERSHYDETNLTQEEFDRAPRCKSCLTDDRAGAELNFMAVDYGRLSLSHDYEASKHVTLTSRVYRSHLFRPRFESRRGGPDVEGGSMRGRVRTYRQTGAETRLEVANLKGLGMLHTFQTGLRAEQHGFDNRNVSGRVGETLHYGRRGEAHVVRGEGDYGDSGASEDYRALAVSGFVQHSVAIGVLSITPGLRVERYTQDKRTLFDAGETIDTPLETDQRLLVLPGLSLGFDAIPDTQLYAGVYRGYAPAVARTEDYPLDPEIGINSQLGMRSTAVPGLRLEAAVFHNQLENTLIKLSYTDDRGNNIFVNNGSARVQGGEVFGRLDGQTFTGGPLNVYAEANYTFVESRFLTAPADGNRLPEIPRHMGSYTLGVEHTSGWDLSTTLTHRGSFFVDVENTVAGNPDGDLGRVPRFMILSARANWHVPDSQITLFLAGINLTDRLYISDRQDGLRPGQGRTIFGGMTAQL